MVDLKPAEGEADDDWERDEVGDLREKAEDGELVEVPDQGEGEQGEEEHDEKVLLCLGREDADHGVADEEEVGAREAELGRAQGHVHHDAAGRPEGRTGNVTVGYLLCQALLAATAAGRLVQEVCRLRLALNQEIGGRNAEPTHEAQNASTCDQPGVFEAVWNS